MAFLRRLAMHPPGSPHPANDFLYGTLADSSTATGDYDAQQAQGWADYAAGSAAEGLDDLAANAYGTAAEYSGAAETNYDEAVSAEGNVAADLQDPATSLSSLDTATERSTADYTAATEYTDTSAVDEA